MRTKPTFIIFSLLIFTALFGFIKVDDDPIKNILERFKSYLDKNIQEKVYLHTDKPYYAVGEDLWFKAYVVDAKNLTPSTQSNFLYVDFINSRDSVKKTLKLLLRAGFAEGNFELKDSLPEGNYRLRAYTRWMRNFDDAFYFDRTIKIGNAWSNQLITKTSFQFDKNANNEEVLANINFQNIEGLPYANKDVSYQVEIDFRNILKGTGKTDSLGNLSIKFVNDKPFLGKEGRISTSLKLADKQFVNRYIPIKSTNNLTDVQFFPESGQLLTNVKTKTAFKAVGSDGLGRDVEGYVEDSNGNKITTFKSEHLGMGAFIFTPSENTTYKAVVKFQDGSEKSFALPKASTEAIGLTVNPNVGDSVYVRVNSTQNYFKNNTDKPFTVIAQNSGNIVYTAKSGLNSTTIATFINKKRFPAGITQFTLFDQNMSPVAERLIFIHPNDVLAINVVNPTKSNSKRSPVKLKLEVKDPSGNPVIGSFSMSVVHENLVPHEETKEHTIFNNLLLTSDIKGYVEQPNSYFVESNSNKLRDVDLLMLTQGWRRYNWQLLNSPIRHNFSPEKSIQVAGKITQNKGKPVPNGLVTLFSNSGSQTIIQTKTDVNGEFLIDSLFFSDSTKFVVQARNANDKKNVEIEIYNQGLPIVTKNNNSPDLTTNISESMFAYLRNSKSQYDSWLRNGIVNKSILLGEVKVVDTKPRLENSSNLNGAGFADRVLTSKDFMNAISLDQALSGRVAGLQILGGIAYIRGQVAQIILDGMYVEPQFLNSINIQDVESVEILKSIGYTAMYGSQGANGVIVINTKRGSSNSSYKTFAPGIITFNPIGIYKGKTFYVPNYDDPKINTQVADLRTTIYWNPSVVTNKDGQAEVEFFNADGIGKYKVVLEGMDLDGHLGRTVYRYQVSQ